MWYHILVSNDPSAQTVEHLTFNQGVRSSSLRWVTNKKSTMQRIVLFLLLYSTDSELREFACKLAIACGSSNTIRAQIKSACMSSEYPMALFCFFDATHRAFLFALLYRLRTPRALARYSVRQYQYNSSTNFIRTHEFRVSIFACGEFRGFLGG